MAVAGPLGKTDFANQLGFEPGAAFHFRGGEAAAKATGFFRKIHERTIFLDQFVKSLMERFQDFLIEAGADFRGELQFLIFEIADDERAEMLAGAARLRVTADDEFLLAGPFEFHPRAASPPDFVCGILPLRDDAFKPAGFHLR